MQASDQSSERLHQQASAQYLQGKFDAALATWRQILTGDPEDERATEGVRLCELLTEDGATEAGAAAAAAPTATSDEQPIDAGETNVAAAEDAIEFAVPNLAIDLPEKPPAEPETLELDGEIPQIPALESEAIPESDADRAEPELASIVDGILGDDTGLGAEDAAAAELKKRIQDLIGEAHAAYDSGDTETTRAVLTRVFILDERNADALQLQQQIEDGSPTSTEQIDVADLDTPDHAADAAENPAAAAAVVAAVPSGQTETEPTLDGALTSEVLDDPAADSFPEFDVDAEFEEQEEETCEVESETVELVPSKRRLPQLDLGSMKTRWILIGVGLGIFVMVGVGLWMRVRNIEITDVPPPVVLAAEAAAELEVLTEPEPEPDAETVEPEPAPQLNLAPAEDLATLLERGNNAFAAGEYSSAIVAFDAVLKQQPNHFEANERMQAATEEYRRQQEIQQQWIAAASLFRDGEYRSALQMFYRLPKNSEENRVRLERYKENGWYNMGLLALRSGQCALARGHLEEAAEVDPEDADIAMALALCDTCEGGSRRNGFQRAVAAMSMRDLDD